jgi:hypothetical protein
VLDTDLAISTPHAEMGVSLDDLPPGTVLRIRTKNRNYILETEGKKKARIAGHPQYCPEAVSVVVHGSTWGGTMLMMSYIAPGMYLEYRHPEYGVIRTSRIEEVKEIDQPALTEPVQTQ